MATLISSSADNDFTNSASWFPVETGSSASQTTISSSTDTTTSYVWSSAFTITNANTIDGVAIHCQANSSPSGTLTVCLSVDGSAETKTVVVNAADLSLNPSWCLFKFGSALTSGGEATYKVGVKTSSNATVKVYRDGTAGNWGRILRTTNTATAPSASDVLYCLGEYTGQAASSTRTTTVDTTSATVYGNITVGSKGLLKFKDSSAANPYLKMAGILTVWDGGELRIGINGGTVIPSDSTATLNFAATAAAQYYLDIKDGGTFNTAGATRSVTACKLAADHTTGTGFTTDVSTGWLNGDVVAIAPTSRTYTDGASITLSGDASGTSLTAGSAVAKTILGTSPTQAEVILLTRNVKIIADNASYPCNIFIRAKATATLRYTEITNAGSGTTNYRGAIYVYTAAGGSFDMQYSSIHDCTVTNAQGVVILSASGSSNTITINNNNFYNINHNHLVTTSSYGAAGFNFNYNYFISNVASIQLVIFGNSGDGVPIYSFSNNVLAGANHDGIYILEGMTTLSYITSHSNLNQGINIGSGNGRQITTISNLTCWRNSQYGIRISATPYEGIVIDTGSFFGNANGNVSVNYGNVVFKSITSNGGSTLVADNGIRLYASNVNSGTNVKCINCNFGADSAHATAAIDIFSTYVYASGCILTMINCTISDTVMSDGYKTAFKYKRNHDQDYVRFINTGSDYRSYYKTGISNSDSVIYSSNDTISERLTPNSGCVSPYKLQSRVFSVACPANTTVNIACKVRKSSTNDSGGVNYNGAQPRLMVKENVPIGITSDTAVATGTGSVYGTFETLSGTVTNNTSLKTVLQFYVDCDYGSNGGWVNVSDWSAS